MASRCRSICRPTLNLLKSTVTASTARSKLNSVPSLRTPIAFPTNRRSIAQMGSLQSLLPLHSAISSSRLTSSLGVDSKGSRTLSQELGLSVPR